MIVLLYTLFYTTINASNCLELPIDISGLLEICTGNQLNISIETNDGTTPIIEVEAIENEFITGAMDYTFPAGSGVINDILTLNFDEEQEQIYLITIPSISSEVYELSIYVYDEISIIIDGEFNICEGDCQLLDPSIYGGQGSNYTYLWSSGETTDKITVCAEDEGAYSLTVSDQVGCETTKTIFVNNQGLFEITLDAPQIICQDGEIQQAGDEYFIQATENLNNPISSVVWDIEEGLEGDPFINSNVFLIIEENSQPSFEPYLITAYGTSIDGCLDTATIEVSIYPEVFLDVDISNYDCDNKLISFRATTFSTLEDYIPQIKVYTDCQASELIFEDENESGIYDIIDVDVEDISCIYFEAFNDINCTVNTSFEIPELNIIEPNIEGDFEVCKGEFATFEIINADEIGMVNWSPLPISQGDEITFYFDTTTTVTFTYFDGLNLCSESNSFTVTVLPENESPCSNPCDNPISDFQIVGQAYADNNDNGEFENGDYPLSNVQIQLENGITVFTDANGSYKLPVENGTISILAIINYGNWVMDSIEINDVLVDQPCIENIDFGFVPIANPLDIKVAVSNSPTRCDFQPNFYITVFNDASGPFSGNVEFNYDEEVDFFTSEIMNIVVGDSKVTFPTGIIPPYSSKTYFLNLDMPSGSANLPLLDFEANVYLGGDVVESYAYSEQLLCSYDPNDKQVHPSGLGTQSLTLKDEELNYTIRFQNTGNDTAYNVLIKDEIDPAIDLNSLRVTKSSHEVFANIEDNTLSFNFPNIYLVDSLTDPINSQGFVSYSCKLLTPVEDSTIVENTANIFFDSNDAIVTNTTKNTMVESLCSNITTVEDIIICEGDSFQGYTTTGQYTHTQTTNFGCDSTYILNLQVIEYQTQSTEIDICHGESIEIGNTIYKFDSSGTYLIEIFD